MFNFLTLLVFSSTLSCSTDKNTTSNNSLTDIVIDYENINNNNLTEINSIIIKNNGYESPRFYGNIIYRNDTLFILDNASNPGIYAYDKHGKQLFYYNDIGKGKKQCLSIFNFNLGTNKIYINDFAGSKIVQLDMKGKFITSKYYKLLAIRSYVDENNGLVYCDNNNETSKGRCHSLFYYKEDSLCNKFLPIPDELKQLNTSIGMSFAKVGKDIHYYTGLRDTIYSINKNKIRPIYHLNFGKAWPNKEFLKEAKNKLINYVNIRRSSDFVYSIYCLENDEILVVNFWLKDKNYSFIYNKRNKKHLLYEQSKFNRLVGLNNKNIIFAKKGNEADTIGIYRIKWNIK